MTPSSPKVKRTYYTRRKEAERLKELAQNCRKKKRRSDPISDDDSFPSQTLGSFELCTSEIEIIPPWSGSDGDEVNGEAGDDEVVILERIDVVGSCSGVKKDGNLTKDVSVIDVDTSQEEEVKMNEDLCSSYGSVRSLPDGGESESSDDEEDEDYKCDEDEDYSCEKKDKKGKMKKGSVVSSKNRCRKELTLDESHNVDEFNGSKGKKGRDGEESVQGKKKDGEVLILDSSEGDSVVEISPKEDAFKKKKAALP